MFDDLDLTRIPDENTRELVRRLLNLVEKLSADLRDAQVEIQQLRNEVNRLKGEQGQPKIKGNTPKPAPPDHSSEKERHKARQRHKSSKNVEIRIDREQKLEMDRALLPEDAQYKGYEDVVVQDLKLGTDNVRFRKEKYYSPSTQQSYLADLPRGYQGQFGPGVQALVLSLYYGMQASEPKIHEFFENVGIHISAGAVSNLLIKNQEGFHAEKEAVYEAGLRSSPFQHTDDTLTRVDGQNQHCHVLCNPVYTIFATRPSKERLVVLDVLRHGRPRVFRLNAEAMGYLEATHMPPLTRRILQEGCGTEEMSEKDFLSWLESHLPALTRAQRRAVLDAAAVAAYHQEKECAVIQALICDDAPQFHWLTRWRMLCWVHEGRHYKKLTPVIPLHQGVLADFLKSFWKYYDQLLSYRLQPIPAERQRLEAEFDRLFSQKTGYAELDQRIAQTRKQKDDLLWVLPFPELPLHNNAAELAVRQRVRKRDVSFGPRTQEGVQAWDTFMSLAATAKKLGVSFYKLIQDRISGANQIPPLANLVETAAQNLRLGWSFSSTGSAPTC